MGAEKGGGRRRDPVSESSRFLDKQTVILIFKIRKEKDMFSKVVTGVVAVAFTAGMAIAAEKDPIKPRVPADKIAAAKAMKNPVASTPENIAKGKAIFEGKGGCTVCHGPNGLGDGPGAVALDPSPRNFTNKDWQKSRTDGELFWVVRNGSPGTGMIPVTTISEEEAWQAITYVRSLGK
jgi:mono/diheme cytochrome c family protein